MSNERSLVVLCPRIIASEQLCARCSHPVGLDEAAVTAVRIGAVPMCIDCAEEQFMDGRWNAETAERVEGL